LPALPPAPAASPNTAAQVVFGGCAGLVLGCTLGALLLLVPAFLQGAGGRNGMSNRSVGTIWLIESGLLLVALIYFVLPVAHRIPPFVRSLAIATAFVALGGLSLCDVFALSTMFAPQPRYAPLPYRTFRPHPYATLHPYPFMTLHPAPRRTI
jgi:hypothetical protein